MLTIINKFRVDGFRNLDNVEIDGLAPVVAFTGANRQGKTSLQYALQWLCLGWCVVTSRNGAGADALLGDGRAQAVIEGEFEFDLESGEPPAHMMLQAVIKRKGANEFKAFSVDTGEVFKGSREEFWRAMGINPAHLIPTLMPEYFTSTTKEWDVIADVVAPNLNAQDVLAECGEHLDWVKAFAKRTGNPMDIAADFQAIGARAYAERTERNGALKEANALLINLPRKPRPVNASGKALTAADLDGLRASVGRQENLLHALHEELGTAKAAGEVDRDALVAEVDAATQAEVEAAQVAAKAESTFAATTEALAQAKQREANASHENRVAYEGYRAAKEALAALDSGDGCPTCGRAYTDKLREKLLKPLEDAHSVAFDASRAAKAEADDALTALAPARAAEDTARQAHQVAADAARVAAQRAAEARAKLNNVPESARPVADIEADITSAQEKLERGRGLVDQLELLRKHDDIDGHIKAVEAELAHLDWAVKAFKDGEVLRPLLRGGLEEFADLCNAELAPYGYSLIIDVDGKKIQILLQEDGRRAIDIAQCSGGERVLAAAAIASAFAARGCPVALDEVQKLDAVWRKQMLGRLRGCAGGSLWLAWASQTSDVAWEKVAAQLAPVTVVRVEGGNATVVDAAEVG